MHQNISSDFKNRIIRNKRRTVFKRIVSALSCTVMFCTTYALILPAITMEQDTFCGVEEHTHSQACYGQIQQKNLICTAEHLNIHVHTDGCYGPEGNLICGQCDYIAHSHNDSCRNTAGELVCTLTERSVHVHTDSCYAPGETQAAVLHVHSDQCNVLQKGDLVCTLREYEGHAHSDACYEISDVLLCSKPENHVHGDSCYQLPLNCSLSTAPHTHSDSCYGRGSRICSIPEAHVHGDSCRETVSVCANEAEDHTHGDSCYETRTFCQTPENHSHGNGCYESIVVCGKEAGEQHTHGGSCYGTTPELICNLAENHVHDSSCYEPRLICTTEVDPGHSHGDDCYSWETVIGCGMEEGDAEPTEPAEPVLVCTEATAQVHVHGEACFEVTTTEASPICGNEAADHEHTKECYVIQCSLEEHTHGTACYSDPNADLETEADWKATFAHLELTGNWNDDVLAIAKTQLGYRESANNYAVWADDTTHGYTRYGQWYGSPYGDWCAMFVSFCLNYAEVEGMPLHWGVRPWIEELTELKLYHEAEVYDPKPGDLIFYDWEGDELSDHVGFVAEIIPETEYEPAQVVALEGNSSNCVQYVYYEYDDSRILGYSELPDNIEIYSCGILRHVHNEYCVDDAGNRICMQVEHLHTELCEPRDTLYCGMDVHSHAEDCFDEAGELICDIPEHNHIDDCYVQTPEEETEPVYYCGQEEHTHIETCYDEAGELVCEISEHTHTEECTAEPVIPTYYCGQEEHTHAETCYDEAGELVCEIPEHTHTEECTAEPVVYYCGQEEHTHAETCYDEAGELVCEIPEHTHTEECTAEPVVYYCGQEEHTHAETCYDEAGELICEIPEHTHTEECTTEPVVYYCFKQEHTHTEVCYDEAGNLLCPVPEHTHTDDCTKIPVYLCGMEEHAHGEECYDETGSLICQIHEHVHSEQCVIVGGYICGMEEHTHNENCYDAEGNFICTLEEHTHTDACKAQNTYACGLDEHTHGEGCYDEEGNLICEIPEHIHTAACVGRNLYYSDMQIRVHAVISGVENLPDKLQLVVQPVIQDMDPESFGSMEVALSREMSSQERYISNASFFNIFLLSEGAVYELPETAVVTVTMEFEQPIFTPKEMEESAGTHAYIMAPEGGLQLNPVLTETEEVPVESQPEETTPTIMDSVTNAITNVIDALVPAANAMDDIPEADAWEEGSDGEPDDPESNEAPPIAEPVYEITSLTGESYGNQEKGITSVTFVTNRLATFAVTVTTTTKTGEFWERIDSEDDITADDTYMIVSAEGNYALRGDNDDNSVPVIIQTVPGNTDYYTIARSDGEPLNNALYWTINNNTIQNQGTKNYLYPYSQRTGGSNWNPVYTHYLMRSSSTTVSLNYYAPEYCWRITYSGYYLKNDGSTNDDGSNDFFPSNSNDGSGKGTLNSTVNYYHNADMLIFKLSDVESLEVPNVPTESSSNNGSVSQAPPKPDYGKFIKPSGASTGGTSVKGCYEEPVCTLQEHTHSETCEENCTIPEHTHYLSSVRGSYYSDPATSDLESKFRTDTYELNVKNDGKVMTDKSVIYGGDDYRAFNSYNPNTFGVTLSVLGQQYPVPWTDVKRTPIDVVFVLDVSGSMTTNETETEGETRAEALSKAFNQAADYIMTSHPSNRFGVALFSTGAWEMLPLSRYTANDMDGDGVKDYTVIQDTTMPYYDGYSKAVRQFIVGGSSLKVETENGTGKSYAGAGSLENTGNYQGIGTYTQAGIAMGQRIFSAIGNDVEYSGTIGTGAFEQPYTVTRQPIYILLSDGEPTHATNLFMDPLSGPHYGNGNASANSTNVNGVQGFYTILSANYFKDRVSIQYGIPALFYSIGLGIKEPGVANDDVSPGSSSTGDRYKRAVLDPDPSVINGNNFTSEYLGEQTVDVLKALLAKTENKQAISTAHDWPDPWMGVPHAYVPVLQNYDSYVSNYAYADDSFFGKMSTDKLAENFKKIINQGISDKPYGFILYQSTKVDITDTIGEGMEIKGTPVLRYGGNNYTNPSVSVNGNVTAYTYSGTFTDPYIPKRTVDLSAITVTVTKTGDTQVVNMIVPADALPTYTPELIGGKYYYESLPVRLIYQVGLTDESVKKVLDLNKTGGEMTFYTNAYSGTGASKEPAASTLLIPSVMNPFYNDVNNDGTVPPYQAHNDPKTSNPTDTVVYSVDCSKTTHSDSETINVIHKLGNNGKLVFKADTVKIPVEKDWGDVPEAQQKPVTVTLYRVTENTSAGDDVTYTGEPVENGTVTLNSANKWMHTFTGLPVPNENFSYAIVETDSAGFQPQYTGGNPIYITSDSGKVQAVIVNSDFFNAETKEPIGVITIKNLPAVELPKTGGPGTILYTTGGLLLMAAAIILLFYNRKSQISRP